MVEWIKQNSGYNKILVTLFIGLLSFLALTVYNKTDSLPDKFVRIERYNADQEQYQTDQHRIEKYLERLEGKVDRLIERR